MGELDWWGLVLVVAARRIQRIHTHSLYTPRLPVVEGVEEFQDRLVQDKDGRGGAALRPQVVDGAVQLRPRLLVSGLGLGLGGGGGVMGGVGATIHNPHRHRHYKSHTLSKARRPPAY